MEKPMPPGRFHRRLERRIERRGLRPRFAAAVIIAFWAAGVVIFGVLERLVDPTSFDNVWLAMWWAMQTVTTVGYGDVVPGETAGRVIAAVLMLGGLSLYAVVTGVITSIFVTRAGADRQPVMQRLQEMDVRVGAMSAELDRLEQSEGRSSDSH
jgi:voltage-gated potassium channel